MRRFSTCLRAPCQGLIPSLNGIKPVRKVILRPRHSGLHSHECQPSAACTAVARSPVDSVGLEARPLTSVHPPCSTGTGLECPHSRAPGLGTPSFTPLEVIGVSPSLLKVPCCKSTQSLVLTDLFYRRRVLTFLVTSPLHVTNS
jgi:hypothetical protein